MNLDLEYPNLSEALYNSSNLKEAQKKYVSMLRETGNVYLSQYASKLEESVRMLSPENLKQLEEDFRAYKDCMRDFSRETGIQLFLLRRQKDFVGLNAKIRLYIQSCKNLSQIHDLLGFRIVLQTGCPDTMETIIDCYKVLNETIKFFALKRNCMFLKAEPRSDSEITPVEAEKLKLVIPEKDYILFGFQNNVKDYVLHPKPNGYQSLHILIQSPSGLIFEVQVRTTSMDIVSEYGSALHSEHKSTRYDGVNLGNIDYSKINMPGFMCLSSGELYDSIGLQKSIDPFNVLY